MAFARPSFPSWSSAPRPTGAVDRLRVRGLELLAALGWLCLVMILVAGAVLEQGDGFALLAVGGAILAGPTWVAARGRYDAEARLIAAPLVAFMPALLVFVLRGHPWQMDAHMYFFVALASLTMLCDWRPIALASGLIAVHHLLLEWSAPSWVFADTGNLGRVLFHAGAVVLQCAILSFVANKLLLLIERQDAAVAETERLLRQAEVEQVRAATALTAAEASDRAAASERVQRERVELRSAAERRAELITLASQFEGSVLRIVRSVDAAIGALAGSAGSLDQVARAAGQEAQDVARNADRASVEIHQVASALQSLGRSATTIGTAAEQQRMVTGDAQAHGRRSADTIARLADEADQIEAFVADIRKIAATTNLLALNATIEAARAGDAGRGFAVVASEVKALAASSERASDQIAVLLESIRAGMERSRDQIGEVSTAIAEVAEAADAVATAVSEQRTDARGVEASATRAADSAQAIELRIGHVASAAVAAATLAGEVRSSIAALGDDARDLSAATERFVSFLRDTDAAPAG
ncbi:methyl-accepting chemotaxis protein [Sphingomonas guangdongensis]|uniref:Methyl-accepting chemotaxis protein n=1 Tax=Sphingomonas guangdongensis TaxID=1141890 RepID=A0A285QE68_9SPHN|nr:methyl-accepting chemotaxis protein [Sphingomonas guangdongensis]SOB79774.1 methyl-accepting chemotaxis protein [Sphingomonas guangdongensis]